MVSDIYLTATAELADVVLPALAGWAETEGTVTSSERRVQRVRAVVEGPAGARSDIDIICEVAQRMGTSKAPALHVAFFGGCKACEGATACIEGFRLGFIALLAQGAINRGLKVFEFNRVATFGA